MGLGFELRASCLHLPLESHIQFTFSWLLWTWSLPNFLPKLALNGEPPDLIPQVVKMTGVSYWHPALSIIFRWKDIILTLLTISHVSLSF
jgi:hypothetical protein